MPAAVPVRGEFRRDVSTWGAVGLGLGSILGTGVFVTLGLAAGAAGSAVGLALATTIAALVALCNALSSAQLVATFPVAGGTYEYGYRLLHPSAGFAAGALFVLAKTASAATAALGAAAAVVALVGATPATSVIAAGGLVAVATVTTAALLGVKRTAAVNGVIVTITLLSLVIFVSIVIWSILTGADSVDFNGHGGSMEMVEEPRAAPGPGGVLVAAALVFVAFTGYGRIATLGEEVSDPRRTIPRAVMITLGISATLYIAVGLAAVGAVGAERYATLADAAGSGGGVRSGTGNSAAPLQRIAGDLAGTWAGAALAVGAVTAMAGVLLNLVLGISRVTVAMARRGDAPARLARIDGRGVPVWSTVVVAVVIGAIAALGSIRLAWSFSAVTVLVYYAITNAAALRLPDEQRLYPAWIAAAGLCGCLALAAFVEWRIVLVAAASLAAMFAVRWILRAATGLNRGSTAPRAD